MERRLFLTGMLGLAGATLAASVVKPGAAVAGVPGMSGVSGGILDELDSPLSSLAEEGDGRLEPEKVRSQEFDRRQERRGHWRYGHRPRRRPVWRRVCRRFRRNGHWRERCWRERVWVWR